MKIANTFSLIFMLVMNALAVMLPDHLSMDSIITRFEDQKYRPLVFGQWSSQWIMDRCMALSDRPIVPCYYACSIGFTDYNASEVGGQLFRRARSQMVRFCTY